MLLADLCFTPLALFRNLPFALSNVQLLRVLLKKEAHISPHILRLYYLSVYAFVWTKCVKNYYYVLLPIYNRLRQISLVVQHATYRLKKKRVCRSFNKTFSSPKNIILEKRATFIDDLSHVSIFKKHFVHKKTEKNVKSFRRKEIYCYR